MRIQIGVFSLDKNKSRMQAFSNIFKINFLNTQKHSRFMKESCLIKIKVS